MSGRGGVGVEWWCGGSGGCGRGVVGVGGEWWVWEGSGGCGSVYTV